MIAFFVVAGVGVCFVEMYCLKIGAELHAHYVWLSWDFSFTIRCVVVSGLPFPAARSIADGSTSDRGFSACLGHCAWWFCGVRFYGMICVMD